MMIALWIILYFAVALLCAYGEGRLSGDTLFTAMWLLWPAVLPIVLAAWTFEKIAELGERHSR